MKDIAAASAASRSPQWEAVCVESVERGRSEPTWFSVVSLQLLRFFCEYCLELEVEQLVFSELATELLFVWRFSSFSFSTCRSAIRSFSGLLHAPETDVWLVEFCLLDRDG